MFSPENKNTSNIIQTELGRVYVFENTQTHTNTRRTTVKQKGAMDFNMIKEEEDMAGFRWRKGKEERM